jgi:N utilization substance protein B
MVKKAAKNVGVHHDRTVARRKAVQLLYQAQILGQPLSKLLGAGPLIEEIGVLPEYSRALINGLDEHLDEVDVQLSDASKNWSLARMPLVDRCILRLAAYEMLFVEHVPVSVSINEAVELAHEFGGEDGSGSFVNGVLGNIARGGEARKLHPLSNDEPSEVLDNAAHELPQEPHDELHETPHDEMQEAPCDEKGTVHG